MTVSINAISFIKLVLFPFCVEIRCASRAATTLDVMKPFPKSCSCFYNVNYDLKMFYFPKMSSTNSL